VARALRTIAVSRTFEAGISGCVARVRAVDSVSFHVHPAEVFGIFGAAGSGKSTLLLLLAGLLRADAGSVIWQGASGESLREPLGVEYLPQWRSEHVIPALHRALAQPPGLLLLDDSLGELDGVARREGRVLLRELRGAGVTMVLAAREMGENRSLCSRAAFMREGRLLVAPRIY